MLVMALRIAAIECSDHIRNGERGMIMRRILIAMAVLALATFGVGAQTAFEGNEYEGTNVRVEGPDAPICPATGSLRYRVVVRGGTMQIEIMRAGDPQTYRDTTPINPDGSFGRTRQFPDGSVSISNGRVEAQQISWEIKVQRSEISCLLRADLARVASRLAK
jgi:hypothetical protein